MNGVFRFFSTKINVLVAQWDCHNEEIPMSTHNVGFGAKE